MSRADSLACWCVPITDTTCVSVQANTFAEFVRTPDARPCILTALVLLGVALFNRGTK